MHFPYNLFSKRLGGDNYPKLNLLKANQGKTLDNIFLFIVYQVALMVMVYRDNKTNVLKKTC